MMGFGNGGIYALMAVVIEEVFGPKDLPLKYSCCMVAGCLGSLIFSDLVAGSRAWGSSRQCDNNLCVNTVPSMWTTQPAACPLDLGLACPSQTQNRVFQKQQSRSNKNARIESMWS